MGGTRFFLAGSLIDGSGAPVRRNVFLAVRDGMITDLGPAADLPRHDGLIIDDFSYCTLLPALVDCSVSLARSPSVDWRVRLAATEAGFAHKAALVARHIHYCQGHGVQGVAVNDDITDLTGGKVAGGIIDIRASGPRCRGRQLGVADNTAGGDFVRIGYSWDIADKEAPCPRLDHGDLCRILGSRGGKKAVVVANGRQQVAEAIAAGCDAIEQGYGMGEDNLRAMAKRGVLWIPSVLRAKSALDGVAGGGEVCCRFSLRYVAPGEADPGAEAFWQKVLAAQLAQLRLAKELGVTTAVGTGAGSVGILHGESMVEEMKLFLKAGYSLAETIRSASENGAGFFGMEKLGMLTVGRAATFLLTRGTVQQLPRKLAYLEGIYVDGVASATYHKNPVQPAG
jgi:imidazolonepropionase-like amidohydrolase